jgi:hypothetical protein
MMDAAKIQGGKDKILIKKTKKRFIKGRRELRKMFLPLKSSL